MDESIRGVELGLDVVMVASGTLRLSLPTTRDEMGARRVKFWCLFGDQRDGNTQRISSPLAASATRVDRPARLRDDVLHDREPETRSPRGPRAVGPEEPLEQSRQLRLGHADPVVEATQDVPSSACSTASVNVEPGPAYLMAFSARFCATTRSIRGRTGSSTAASPSTRNATPALAARSASSTTDRVELWPNGHRSERDDAGARFELAQEEHLVDQLTHLLDLLAGLIDELEHVLTRKCRRLEKRQQARERGTQLV